MIGVEDLARSKAYYADGLGCTIEQDYPGFVELGLGEGSSSLALCPRDAAAQTRASRPRAGFRGSRSTIVSSNAEVDEVMTAAVKAGGAVVKEAAGADRVLRVLQRPDGYLWKVATGS